MRRQDDAAAGATVRSLRCSRHSLPCMIDTILKYLSVITVAGAAISFIVGLVKYLDQRKREERTTRFKTFHELMGPIVARGERSNEGLALSQQVAAVYELQHFKDYSYASVPILEETCVLVGERRRRRLNCCCGPLMTRYSFYSKKHAGIGF